MRIGFVNDDVIKEKYPSWQRAQKDWDQLRKELDDSIQIRQAEIQRLMADLDSEGWMLSEDVRNERMAAIRHKQERLSEFTNSIYGPNGTIETRQDEIVKPLLDNVNNAIESVAKVENYDVIFTLQSGLGYIKDSYDITQKVLDALEKLEK